MLPACSAWKTTHEHAGLCPQGRTHCLGLSAAQSRALRDLYRHTGHSRAGDFLHPVGPFQSGPVHRAGQLYQAFRRSDLCPRDGQYRLFRIALGTGADAYRAGLCAGAQSRHSRPDLFPHCLFPARGDLDHRRSPGMGLAVQCQFRPDQCAAEPCGHHRCAALAGFDPMGHARSDHRLDLAKSGLCHGAVPGRAAEYPCRSLRCSRH